MRVFKRRPRAVLGVLATAAATAFFVLPVSPASAATFPNACENTLNTNNTELPVTLNGNSPASVSPGDSFTLSNISQSVDIPPAVFVTGYRAFVLQVGENTITVNSRTVIEGTNTAEGTQTTNTATTQVTTTITDPTPANRNSGDESATPGTASVTYDDQTWTAGAEIPGDPAEIQFREDTVLPLDAGAQVGGIVVQAVIGPIQVFFACSPGTVDPNPPPEGTPTFVDPAVSFATTDIVPPVQQSAISINDQTVGEGGTATFTVSLDQPNTQPITVNFDTSDGTANAPADYLSNSGTVTFAPGETSQTVAVNTNQDSFDENDETFNVDLSNATGPATIADNQGVGTILDDDPEPAISINDAQALEGDAVTFTVTLDAVSGKQVTVQFATSDGTATGADYTSASGTVTFAPGSTSESVTVQTTEDTLDEPDETFNVDLSNATNATIADNQGVGTILDDDVAAVPDAAMNVIVSGPTRSAAGDKTIKATITNAGTSSFQVCDTDVDWNITVGGVATTGTVDPLNPGCKTLAPGGKTTFRYRWTFGAGEVTPGATVVYEATVAVAGDANAGNNTDMETRTAK